MITRRRSVLLLIVTMALLASALAHASGGAPDALPVLSGVAVDPLGRGVAGVDIVLSPAVENSVAPVTTTRSDENGHFVVGGLAPGPYRVVAVKGGYSVLVGKIDTLLRDTLELVLRPAGQISAPGSRPADSSWVLRLAARDRLESLGHALHLDGSSQARQMFFDGPMLVEVHSSSLEGANSGSGGLNAMIAGELPVEDVGTFGLSFRHRAEEAASMIETADLLSVHWLPAGDISSGVPAVQLDTIRRSRLVETGSAQAATAQFESEGARFQTTWALLSPGRALEARIDGALLRGRQQLDPQAMPWQDYDARRISLSLGLHRAWGEHHETVASLSLRDSHGVFSNSPAGGEQILSMMTLADGSTAMGIAEGQSIDLTLVDRWSPRPRMALHTRWRAEREYHGLAETRLAAGLGGRWDTPLGFSLEAEGAFSMDETGTDGLWALGLGRAGENWHWSIGHAHEAGLVPWEEDQIARGPGTTSLVTDRNGRVGRWVLSAGWQPNKRWPAIAVRGERYEMHGRLAARIPGDVPVVPVSELGYGIGSRMEMTLLSHQIGTFVTVAWSELEDRGPNQGLLSGASLWRGRELSLRQSLGAGWAGLSWQVLLNFEEGRLPRSKEPEPRGRLALLAQRRFSGGLAVIF